ncbi:MAG: hypothetical protein V6Z86_09760 [Hyphomicrobiales bacterium]
MSMPGNPTIAVEARIQRGGLPSGVDGLWSITTVTHTIDADGFKTQIKAETPSEWFSAERFSRESEIGAHNCSLFAAPQHALSRPVSLRNKSDRFSFNSSRSNINLRNLAIYPPRERLPEVEMIVEVP